jgi:hypothetical protein
MVEEGGGMRTAIGGGLPAIVARFPHCDHFEEFHAEPAQIHRFLTAAIGMMAALVSAPINVRCHFVKMRRSMDSRSIALVFASVANSSARSACS